MPPGTKWLVVISSVLLALGMVGWVVPRAVGWPFNDMLIALWLVSIALTCAGIASSALLFFLKAPRAGRPFILQVFGFLALLWGLLFVAFNLGPGDDLEPVLSFSRVAIAVPLAVVAGAMVVLLVVGWKDFCDPRVWKSAASEKSL